MVSTDPPEKVHARPENSIPTPGEYLRKRRESAHLTRHMVALMLDTAPPVSARSRVEWLALIEADVVPLAPTTIDALADCFAFDRFVLHCLDELHRGVDRPAPQLCRSCACSWDSPCVGADATCRWVRPDLCSACAPAGTSADPPAWTGPVWCGVGVGSAA